MSKAFELGALVTFKDGGAPCVVIDRRETADGSLEYKVERSGVQLSWLPPDALELRKKKSTDDLARLQAENARLRDALETIAADKLWAMSAAEIARKALEGGE